MLKPIFTLDYEIHGNGDGCPHALMVEPTNRLLRLFDEFGAKLTIMADVAEILRFKAYAKEVGRDDYHYDAIADQLQHAIATGHDVQLHIHSSYFNATHAKGHWAQDWTEYNFAGLPYERMDWMVRTCKDYLETLLRPVNPGYSCLAFRAANWAVTPSRNVVRALANNGIQIDTSVFKYGRRYGNVTFDYSHAHSPMIPWRVSEDDICSRDDNGRLWELPIYSEWRWIGAFLTFGRLHRVFAGRRHKLRNNTQSRQASHRGSDEAQFPQTSLMRTAFRRQAWKADFNQCEGRQLIGALRRASDGYASSAGTPLPFILIGHSKLFTGPNERRLKPFLSYVCSHSDRFGFDTLTGISRSQGHWKAQ